MAIRKIVSRSITDGTIVDADCKFCSISNTGSQGGGYFQGEMWCHWRYMQMVKKISFV